MTSYVKIKGSFIHLAKLQINKETFLPFLNLKMFCLREFNSPKKYMLDVFFPSYVASNVRFLGTFCEIICFMPVDMRHTDTSTLNKGLTTEQPQSKKTFTFFQSTGTSKAGNQLTLLRSALVLFPFPTIVQSFLKMLTMWKYFCSFVTLQNLSFTTSVTALVKIF